MRLTVLFVLGLMLCTSAIVFAQKSEKLHGNEFSINAFRNPSIGAEIRHNKVSGHIGYYTTILTRDGKTSTFANSFIRTGISYWYLVFGKSETPSALYTSASWLRGIDFDYKSQNVALIETGARFHIWHGINFRLGVALLTGGGKPAQINPTPGLSWSYKFK